MVVVSSCREMLGLSPQQARPLLLVAIIELGTLAGLQCKPEEGGG